MNSFVEWGREGGCKNLIFTEFKGLEDAVTSTRVLTALIFVWQTLVLPLSAVASD